MACGGRMVLHVTSISKIPGLNFNEHAKFTIIEKINNVFLSRQQRKRFLEKREDFWILRFETLSLQKV